MLTSNQTNPLQSPIEDFLAALHAKHASDLSGHVADYIPELAKANPNWFGICIATRDGHVYEIGDTRQHFTIQSISKALAYGLALEDRGEDYILSKISVEPSGDAFNAISLKPQSGAPFNPMINAGAIATDGQVLVKDNQSRIERLLAYLSACAGRSLDIDRIVYESESDTGHRNRAIGWMLRNFDIIDEEPTDILETYFQQCAIRVTCRDLAIMGATLANQGRNPMTAEQAIRPEFIDNILSVMSSCGMYDYSGEWLYQVGLPAKSGVGGGILAVLPGQLGIGIFSPPLDEQGNSVRGIKVCADLSRDLSLHLFAGGSIPQPQSCIRNSYDGSQVSSRFRRTFEHQQTLRANGHLIRILELQGELIFSSVESIIRMTLKHAPYSKFIIHNLRNVVSIDDVSERLLIELNQTLKEQGVTLVLCDNDRLSVSATHAEQDTIISFTDEDAALEFCENGLLQEKYGNEWNTHLPVSLANTFLLSDLSEPELKWMSEHMESYHAKKGDFLIHAGDAADSLYIIESGSVVVKLPSEFGNTAKRIDVFVAGMSFGEMGFLDGSPRSADVIALDDLSYRVISRKLFDELDTVLPNVKIKLFEKLSAQLSFSLRRLNNELSAYKG